MSLPSNPESPASPPRPPDFPDPDALARALEALARPRPVPLAEWRDEVLSRYASKARTTRYRVRQALDEALAVAGPGATTEALGPGLVGRLRARPGAPATTAGLLAALRTAMRIGAGQGWLRASAVRACDWSAPESESDPRPKSHRPEDVAAVLGLLARRSDTWEGGRLYAFACLCAYAGLRRNEALRLRLADVDLARGLVRVRPNGRRLKTRSSRGAVPAAPPLLAALGAWLPRCGSEWVVPNRDRRGPWVGGRLGARAGDRLKAAGRECGVEGLTPHSLRHTVATVLATRMGWSPRQVQLFLRHASTRTQEYYVHEDPEGLRRLLEGFGYGRPARPSGTAGPPPLTLRAY